MRLSWTLAASLLTTGLEAAPLDWVSSQEELSALSQLSAGYAAAMLCNREIKIEIAEQFLQARFGDKRFSAAQHHGAYVGLFAAVGAPGRIRLGDPVWLVRD